MTTYLVLFRGVYGPMLPVQPLKAALIEDGFERVVTYINTGNVVLVSSKTPKQIIERVSAIVLKHFNFSKHIMVVSKTEWAKAIRDNPYPVEEPRKLHVFILEKEPHVDAVKALAEKATGPEQFEIRGKVLYYYTPQDFSNGTLHPKFERTLGVAATARNWNTVLKLQEVAKAI